MTWRIAEHRGSAGELHDRPMADRRTVDVLVVERPSLVLGSTQRAEDVDTEVSEALLVEVARRRSGGGAVLLLPGDGVWLDVTIPAGDPLWDDDVARAFHWVGRAWAEALTGLGALPELSVHTGAPVVGEWSRRVCFAGIGAGEVVAGHRKVVGISQRRTREAARFQCAVVGEWDPVPLLGLLRLTAGERVQGLRALREVALGVPVDPDALVDAFLAALPD